MTRKTSYGERGDLTAIDRLGVWLSVRQVRRRAGPSSRRRIIDIGCGYDARLLRELSEHALSAVAVDVSLSPALRAAGIQTREGRLPDALVGLADETFDLIACINVLEHIGDPGATLQHIRRLLAPGGVALINVPTWAGKRALEFSAFRFGLSPRDEINDHKCYYDPRDLWPLLVAAGFEPSNIRCFRHKLRLNTFAVCRAPR